MNKLWFIYTVECSEVIENKISLNILSKDGYDIYTVKMHNNRQKK